MENNKKTKRKGAKQNELQETENDPHRLETSDGETVEIRLQANYQIIFDEIRTGKADFATKALFDSFVDTYSNYCNHCRQWYQDIANSGKVRTDEMCELVNIFDVMGKYFASTMWIPLKLSAGCTLQ